MKHNLYEDQECDELTPGEPGCCLHGNSLDHVCEECEKEAHAESIHNHLEATLKSMYDGYRKASNG